MRSLVFLFLILICSACSTGGMNEKHELKNYFQTGAYDVGLKYLEESKFFKTDKEKLLYLMEKGSFLFTKGDFQNASTVFEEALSLVKENYTISLSSKIEKGISNDNVDKFYGEIYEQSFLHFYATLSYLSLYYQTMDRNFLFKARAGILGWDSFLESVKEDRVGKTVYKKDLILKIYGAKIHELVGTREDINIAINLYKDAEDILFKNYNTYESFNSKNAIFKKDYSKLSTLKLSDVKKDYIDETLNFKNISSYIAKSKEHLLKKINSDKVHFTYLFQTELIAEKVADKIDVSLEGLSNDPFMRYFLASVLGLFPSRNEATFGDVQAGMATADITMKLFKVYYELPKVIAITNSDQYKLEIFQADQKIEFSQSLNLINPMSELAKEAVEESQAIIKARTAARVAGKHLTAITASFATYKALGGGNKENGMAKMTAVLQYAAATRLIAETESADLRQWTSLPDKILMADLDLDPGTYKLIVKKNNVKYFEQELSIKADDQNKIIFNRK